MEMFALNRWIVLLFCALSLNTPAIPFKPVQFEMVDFGEHGKIAIEALEPLHEPLRLTFKSESGRVIQEMSFKVEDSPLARRIRFKILHVDGLPDPLILAVVNTNGASDCYYYPIPIARANGKFRRLLTDNPEFATQGGMSLGSLGARGGVGLAIWSFIWGPGESHYDRHRYRVEFYRWNQSRAVFQRIGSHSTRELNEGTVAALTERINPDDIIDVGTLRDWFPEYSC